MIESELFGHEKGSFTGASERRAGCFELAQHGTLLLDEIGEMPMQTQAKLLRILEDSKVRRLGGKTEFEVDVRVVAATNKVPEEAVRGGHLREDLYYRLNVFHIHLPPLRERKEDMPSIAEALLGDLNRKHECQRERDLAGRASKRFKRHHWPGNVRELRNVLERAVILAGEGTIELKHLPAFLQPRTQMAAAQAGASDSQAAPAAEDNGAITFHVGTTVEEAEKGLILRTLEHTATTRPGRGDPGNQPEDPAQQVEGVRSSPGIGSESARTRLASRVQVVVDGVERQFQPVGNAQLVEDVVQVVLHRLLADEHLLGHFLVLESLRHQGHDFPLALAERRPFAIARRRRASAAAGASSAATNWRITAAVVCESSQISPAWTLRMLLISSSVAVCFRTIPEVPSFIACTNSFLSSEAVRTMTRVLLLAVCSRCRVARPSKPGHLQIEQQDIGLASAAGRPAPGGRPGPARPLRNRLPEPASLQRPSRKIGWSSATTIRIFGLDAPYR